MNVHPLFFEPIFKPKIWGGRLLETLLHKPLPPETPIGESWEVADLEEGRSIVRAGPARGRALGELVRDWGTQLLGGAELFGGRFPLLIKYLDAQQHLSVQVHPDAAMARRLGGRVRVKNEAWYIVHAEPDGCIYRGFHPGTTRDDFIAAIEQGAVAETLHRIPVKPGQCYYLPSGTVHALGAGVVVAEVQTPSDITYRLYDWDRVDPATGRGRELHISEALECASFAPFDPAPEKRSHVGTVWSTATRLITCDSFIIERVRMTEGMEQPLAGGRLIVKLVLQGRGRIDADGEAEGLAFGPGDTLVLPAGLAGARWCTEEDCVWLEVTLPERSGAGS